MVKSSQHYCKKLDNMNIYLRSIPSACILSYSLSCPQMFVQFDPMVEMHEHFNNYLPISTITGREASKMSMNPERYKLLVNPGNFT